MEAIQALIRLIRPVNLCFIVLTQYLFRYTIVAPIFEEYHVSLALSHWQFAGLVLSTVLVAAGGYAINDYFDVQMDQVNKPRQIVVGRKISRRWTMVAHVVLTSLGILIGVGIAWSIGRIHLAVIHVGVAGLLWLYSTLLKRLPFVGNVLVAALTGLVIFIVALFELWIINRPAALDIPAKEVYVYTMIYSGFAFLISLVREIVKDIEDMQGDTEADCKTLPIVVGMRPAKAITALFVLVTFAFTLIFLIAQIKHHQWAVVAYGVVLIQLPMLYLIYGLYRADKKPDFTRLSGWIKFIMLTGILSMFILTYFAPPSDYL